MRTTNAFTTVFLSIIAAIGLFAASSAFATGDQLMKQSELETIFEVSGDQRMLEIAPPHSLSGCIADSVVSGDQRKPDREGSASEGILTPVKADECTETGYTMPMNR